MCSTSTVSLLLRGIQGRISYTRSCGLSRSSINTRSRADLLAGSWWARREAAARWEESSPVKHDLIPFLRLLTCSHHRVKFLSVAVLIIQFLCHLCRGLCMRGSVMTMWASTLGQIIAQWISAALSQRKSCVRSSLRRTRLSGTIWTSKCCTRIKRR